MHTFVHVPATRMPYNYEYVALLLGLRTFVHLPVSRVPPASEAQLDAPAALLGVVPLG